MQVWCSRKGVSQLHHFDWEVYLVIPTASGGGGVSPSADRLHGCSHIWFAGQHAMLKHIQQTLFQQQDPVLGYAVCLLYILLCTLPRERQNM